MPFCGHTDASPGSANRFLKPVASTPTHSCPPTRTGCQRWNAFQEGPPPGLLFSFVKQDLFSFVFHLTPFNVKHSVRFSFPFLGALIGLLFLTACNQEQSAPKPDGAADRQMQQLVVSWHARLNNQDQIKAVHQQYLALSAGQLDQFNELDARYQVEQLGHNKQLWDLLLQAKKQGNRLSVARHGKGYHQIDPSQHDKLFKEVLAQPAMGQVESLVQINEERLQAQQNARTTATCNIPWNPNATCSNYNFLANSRATFATTASLSTRARCASFWSQVKDAANGDCDRGLFFGELPIPERSATGYWGQFWCETTEAFNVINPDGVGTLTGPVSSPDYSVSKTFLFGATRTFLAGGMQSIANSVRLQN